MTAEELMKVHIWMNFPSHHQRGLFESLKRNGVDLQVTYYENVSQERLALGWSNATSGNDWEVFLEQSGISARERLEKLHNYVHIIPGYGSPMLRQLIDDACRKRLDWCHWSEASHPGLRWWARLPTKIRHAKRVNQYALGAFAQGVLARQDFMRWGIVPEKMADLVYSVNFSAAVNPDPAIVEFASGRGVFLFVGQLCHRKAVDVQLKALAQLGKGSLSWCVVMIGSGDTQYYQRMAADLAIAEKVMFLQSVSWDRIAAVYQAADVLLLPSRFDGWGAVANEAAASGKAMILSTACGAAWHLVNPGMNGYLVEPGSPRSLASAMRKYAVGGRQLSREHGCRSRALYEQFTCDEMAQRIICCIRGWKGVEKQ